MSDDFCDAYVVQDRDDVQLGTLAMRTLFAGLSSVDNQSSLLSSEAM